MNKKIKKQWVNALRSGKYSRGVGQLRDEEDNFCCLGVLCNLHAKANPEIAKNQTDTDYYLGAQGLLPLAVAEWAGFQLSELVISDDEIIVCDVKTRPNGPTLSQMNDHWDGSFNKIADVIEAFL